MRSFCRKTHARKIPRFGGEGHFGFGGGGGGSADFIFMGARIFLIRNRHSLCEFFVSDCWATLEVIVSQNSLVLASLGHRTTIAQYVAKWGIAQMCLCEDKYHGVASRHFGGALTSLTTKLT